MATGTLPPIEGSVELAVSIDPYMLRLQALQLALEYEKITTSGRHDKVLEVARVFADYLSPKAVPVKVGIVFDPPTAPLERIHHNMATLTDAQQIVAHIDEVDSKGNPTDEAGTWSVDRTDILAMVVADDGLSATFTATGVLGSAVVSLTVGDLPTATAAVDVVGGNAASVNLTFDPPTDVTPPATPAS